MNEKIQELISKIAQENSNFKNKKLLDVLTFPPKIIGREKQIEQLVRYLIESKKGFVVPFITIHGRSGSGKSVIAQHVCNNIDEISSVLVNLRQSKTVFGAANMILSELGQPIIASAQGMHKIIDAIGTTIENVLQKEGKNCFVLVLDELDILFYDTRGRPSDFLYRLVTMGENLRKKELLLCIIGILNNGLAEYELDDRVRSRIGSTEIFFEPYAENRILDIITERARDAFVDPVSSAVLEYCSMISSQENGDARRAIDLLRVSAEIAGATNEVLSKHHVDLAREKLQTDRAKFILESGAYHFQVTCLAIAKLAFTTNQEWHKTSQIYEEYCGLIKNAKPLGERRASEILTEIKNSGLVISQTASHGRGGYGTSYKLTVSPEDIGVGLGKEWWSPIVIEELEKQRHNLYFGEEARRKRMKLNLFEQGQQIEKELEKIEKKYEKNKITSLYKKIASSKEPSDAFDTS
ncbi:MAG: Cdc6/Cdc18 family protein [Nitrosotalea sp.]